MTTTRSALWVVEGLAVRPCAAVWLSDSERTASCRRAAAGLLHALGTRLRGDNSGQCGTAVPAPTGTGTGAGTGAGTGPGTGAGTGSGAGTGTPVVDRYSPM